MRQQWFTCQIFFIQYLYGTIHEKYFFTTTRTPVNNGINNKKVRGGQNEIKFPSPKKDKDVKKRHKIINLVHPDAAETPYGWAFENFYDAKEHIKAMGNKTRDTTAIGGEEFKPFDNLTTRWIKTSELGQLLWVIRIEDDGKKNSIGSSQNLCK